MEGGADRKSESGPDPDDSIQRIVESAERAASGIAELADSLVENASNVRREADQLVASLKDAAAKLSGSTARGLPIDAPSDGAQVLVAQLAVGGAGREEIEQRLHDEFGIEDTSGMLDAILGPEGSRG